MAGASEAAPQGGAFAYIRSLDGLRGLAILGVLVEHFPPHYRIPDLSFGGAGVSLFFVLSGYLITRILLNYSNYDVSLSRKAYHFFGRRFLRLTPAYLAAILIGYALDLQGMREYFGYHLFYLTNMLMAWRGDWLHEGGSQFWSLCVEEQFYLIWFFLVVLLARRSLLSAIFGAMLLTVVTRLAILMLGLSPLTSVILPGQSAVLAVGALLALAERDRLAERLAQPFSSPWLLLVSAVAFAAISMRLDILELRVFAYPFAAALVFGCLIRRAVSGKLGPLERPLCVAPLVWTGRISYGLFVYHMLAPGILSLVAPEVHGSLRTAIVWGLSVLIAWASWHLLEQPCLRLKDRISLHPRQSALRSA